MRLEIIASILLLCVHTVVQSRRVVRCPRWEDRENCGCLKFDSRLAMHCIIENPRALYKIANSKYSKDISKLTLEFDGSSLPRSAFHYDNLTELSINGRELKSIMEIAFRGLQDTLLILRFKYTELKTIPSAVHLRLLKLRVLAMTSGQMEILDASLKNLPLEYLDLSNNKIRDIHRDIFPATLRSLNLSDNNLTSLNRTLRGINMHALTDLDLTFNFFANLTGELDDTTNLERLIANHNSILSIDDDSLAKLSKLQFLDLSFNHIHEIKSGLSGLHSLTRLDLSHGGVVIRLGLMAFTNLTSLQVLNISHNGIVHIGVGVMDCLSSLENLVIRSNKFVNLNFLHTPTIYNGMDAKPIRPNNTRISSLPTYCNFRENPKLKLLQMEDSGLKCTYEVDEAICYFKSKGTEFTGNPCEAINDCSS